MQPIPEVDTILEIHRGGDGYIRFFTSGPDGKPSPLASIPLAQLRQRWLPELVEKLSTDSWMTLGSFWRPGTSKQEDLRYINACYVDCDYYKRGSIDFPDAVRSVLRAQREGLLPPASLLIDSGRGLWVVYLLSAKPASREPPRSWSESVELFRRLQAELRTRFQEHLPELEADANASDPCRLARVPGSLSTRSGRQVEYLFQADGSGGFIYTLGELASILGVPVEGSLRRPRLAAVPKPERRRGWVSMLQRRLEDLYTLRQLRGGIPEGTRDFHLYFTAMLLRKLGAGDKQVRAELLDLLSECHQPPTAHNPITRPEALAKIEASREWKRFSNRELAARLAIAPAEAEHLCSIKIRAETKAKAARGDRKAARQEKILELRKGRFGGETPSSRRMAQALQEIGIQVSHAIVAKDYAALGLSPSRRRL